MDDISKIPDLEVKNNLQKIDREYIIDFYKNRNPIIRYSAEQMISDLHIEKQEDFKPLLLTNRQIDYLEHFAMNMDNIEELLEISTAEVVIWKKQSKLFSYIINIIKEAQAEKLESEMWRVAILPENKDNISKMFLLKARKQEYKDNAPPPPLAAINLRISIEGEAIDTLLTSHKPVYDVSEDTE